MEISGRFKTGAGVPNEAAHSVRGERASALPASPVSAVAPVRSQLEPLQSALRALPEVDLDKVAAIKAALAQGEIGVDPTALARDMLAWHRSTPA